jgi:D-ribose pyranose/furanose isomerase RbsD
MSNYEVYIGKLDGKIVYVGHGKKGRHEHLNSGRSHVLQANKLHFEGGSVDVGVMSLHDTKEEAKQQEINMIQDFSPLWNNDHNKMTWCGMPRDIEIHNITGDIITDVLYKSILETSSVNSTLSELLEVYGDMYTYDQQVILDAYLPLENKDTIKSLVVKEAITSTEALLKDSSSVYKVKDVLNVLVFKCHTLTIEADLAQLRTVQQNLRVVNRNLEVAITRWQGFSADILEEISYSDEAEE